MSGDGLFARKGALQDSNPRRTAPFLRPLLRSTVGSISLSRSELAIAASNKCSNARIAGRATKACDHATDAHFRPNKRLGATGKSLIVLDPWLTVNQRVPGSSPGAPNKAFKHLRRYAPEWSQNPS